MNNKSKKLINEINNILKRVNNLPEYTQENVLTEGMVQAIVNDLAIIENKLSTLRNNLGMELNIFPDADCINYDIYPSCKNLLSKSPKPAKATVDDILSEFGEYGDGARSKHPSACPIRSIELETGCSHSHSVAKATGRLRTPPSPWRALIA